MANFLQQKEGGPIRAENKGCGSMIPLIPLFSA